MKVSDNNVLTLEISSDMCWSISLPRTWIDCFASQFDSLCSSITCVKDLQGVLKFINHLKLCVGIADPQFAPNVKGFLQIDLASCCNMYI